MMGNGIPAIATAVGGIGDILQDMENGIVLEDGSAKAITNGIEKAILTPEGAYQEMAGNAIATVTCELHWKRLKSQQVNIYEDGMS